MMKFPIRNTLIWLGLVGVAQAHTTNMTTVTMKLAETGTFDMTVEFDPGEKILGYPRYYEISRLTEPERNAALGAITQQIERELRLSFDGGRTLLQVTGWTLPNAPYETFVDTTTPTMSQIHIKGSAPAHAERLDFMYTSAIALPTPLLFRVDKAGEKLPMSRVVDGPDQPMRPLTLLKPPPPLLSEMEMLVAARLVHSAKIFGGAYARAMVLNWSSHMLPLLMTLALLLRRGWREQVLAVVALVGSCVLWKFNGGSDPRWAHVAIGLLAGLVVVAGVVAALGLTARLMWWILAALTGVCYGTQVSGWAGVSTDAVLSARTVAVLEAVGYGGAWLGFALLAYTMLFQIRRLPVYQQRIAPVAGFLVTGMGLYWVVALLRQTV